MRYQEHTNFGSGRTHSILFAGILFALGLTASLKSQSLGWEGETGVFVAPLAYTATSEDRNVQPVVAYHYFNAGPVIGDFHEISVTAGVGKRLEFGFTHEIHVEGTDPAFSPLWHNGLNIFHGKANLIPENYDRQKWVPAVSVGFIVRSQVHNVGNAVLGEDTTNGDAYVVADTPVRVKVRTPSFVNIPTVALVVKGSELADVPLIQTLVDPCYSCTDR